MKNIDILKDVKKIDTIETNVNQAQLDITKNTTDITSIQTDLSVTENTKYTTVNGVKEFECKNGYIDNIYLEGCTKILDANNQECLPGTAGARLVSVGQGDKIEVLTKTESVLIKSFSAEITNTYGEGHWYNNNGTHLEGEPTTIYDVVIEEDGYYLFENIVSTGTHIETQLLDSSTKFVLKSTDKAPKFFIKGTYCIRHKCNLGKMTVSINLVKVNEFDKKQILTTGRSVPSGTKDIIYEQGGKCYKIKRCEEVVLNGGENWTKSASGFESTNTLAFHILSSSYNCKIGSMVLCDKFNYSANPTDNTTVEYINAGRGDSIPFVINILKSKLTTTQDLAGFKTWLSQNPVTVVYELATPIVEELPNFNPRTFSDKAIILINSGVVQADASFEVTNSIRSELEVLKSKVSGLDDTVKDGYKDSYNITPLNGIAVAEGGKYIVYTDGNNCFIEAIFTDGSIPTIKNTLIGILPQKYRPKNALFLPLFEFNSQKINGSVVISIDGRILCTGGTYTAGLGFRCLNASWQI